MQMQQLEHFPRQLTELSRAIHLSVMKKPCMSCLTKAGTFKTGTFAGLPG
jgi:hypothetical protein